MANAWVYRRPYHRIGRRFLAATFPATARVDDRTASGHVVIAFTTGDTFRLRVQRTSGSDNLQTVDEGSAMTVEVIA